MQNQLNQDKDWGVRLSGRQKKGRVQQTKKQRQAKKHRSIEKHSRTIRGNASKEFSGKCLQKMPPIKKNNSCSYHLKKLIECIQSKESNCDDLIHNFITCLDYKK